MSKAAITGWPAKASEEWRRVLILIRDHPKIVMVLKDLHSVLIISMYLRLIIAIAWLPVPGTVAKGACYSHQDSQ